MRAARVKRPAVTRASKIKARNAPARVNHKAQARVNRYRGRRRGEPRDFSGVKAAARICWRAGWTVFRGFFLLILLGTLSLGLVVGYHYVMHSKFFLVRKVVLNGLDRVSRDDVLSRTGLDQPANILSLKLEEIGRRLEAHPWVEQVALTRKLPDTVIVDVHERRPRTLISLGSIYYLDETGTPFKKVDAQEKTDLPIVTGFNRDDLIGRRESALKSLKEVFALMDVLAERNDRFRVSNISEINCDPVRGLSLITREENILVKIGRGEYRAKLARLGRVLAHLKIKDEDKGLVYFNLEVSPRVIVRRGT